MDKIKELSKNPFKYTNKYNKELELFNKILDKNKNVIESEKEDKLINEFDKLLVKTNNALQSHIRGNVLNDLGYVEIAQLFFTKAAELGYIVESNIVLNKIYEDHDIEDIEEYVSDKLINKFLNIEKDNIDNTVQIKHIDYKNHSIMFTFDDESKLEVSYSNVNKLFSGDQVVFKNDNIFMGITLTDEYPVEQNHLQTELELENMTNETVFSNNYYDNLDNMYFRFTNGYKPSEDPTIKENITEFVNTLPEEYNREEVTDYLNLYNKDVVNDVTLEPTMENFTPGQKYSSDFDYDGMIDYALTIDENTPLEDLKGLYNSMVDVNYHPEAHELDMLIKNLENGHGADFEAFKYMLNTIDESIKNGTFKAPIKETVGTMNLEEDIAKDLYPKIKNIPNYTTTQLEKEIVDNGGTLDMVDKVMSYLVSMGKDFENDEDEDDGMGEPHLKESKVTLPSPIGNDYKQVMPLSGDVNPRYNIFSGEETKYEKPAFNIDAVKRMIENDTFLKFSYHNLLTGEFEKDMELIFNTYIKNDDVYSAKLKTFESYTKMLKENILATAKYTTMLEEVINHFDINLEDNTDALYNMSEFIDENKEKFKSYYALLTPDLKSEFKEKFATLSYAETAEELLNSEFNISNSDKDNITKFSDALNISEQLSLLLMNIVKSVYNQYQYKTFTDDTSTNSILFMTIIAVIFKTI